LYFSNSWVLGSNPIRSMDVFTFLVFFLFILLLSVGRADRVYKKSHRMPMTKISKFLPLVFTAEVSVRVQLPVIRRIECWWSSKMWKSANSLRCVFLKAEAVHDDPDMRSLLHLLDIRWTNSVSWMLPAGSVDNELCRVE
jgi:hypothetical protein